MPDHNTSNPNSSDPSDDLRRVLAECRKEEAESSLDLAKFTAVRDRVRQLVEKVISQART